MHFAAVMLIGGFNHLNICDLLESKHLDYRLQSDIQCILWNFLSNFLPFFLLLTVEC